MDIHSFLTNVLIHIKVGQAKSILRKCFKIQLKYSKLVSEANKKDELLKCM